MRKTLLSLLSILALASLGNLVSASPAEHRHHSPTPLAPRIVAFDHMYGVDGPFVGAANSIRGIPGDELPWAVAHFIRGRLDTDGNLKIQVRGLVFADKPSVPPDLRGKNDESHFRAVVSCLTEQSETVVGMTNVTTMGFPANEAGDADIDAHVDLPNPCVAPDVFVIAGSEDKWFAVTGFEAEGF
jgi:hypothetical protein